MANTRSDLGFSVKTDPASPINARGRCHAVCNAGTGLHAAAQS